MTPQEFRTRLLTQGVDPLIGPCLIEDSPPYAFASDPSTWDDFRDEFVRGLGVKREDVRVVGSGRLGFSMKPSANLRRFSEKSDVDVVVVSPELFDEVWWALLAAFYPRYQRIDRLSGWLGDRRNEIYLGWIIPDKIEIDHRLLGPRAKKLGQLKSKWFNVLKVATQHPPLPVEDVKGRLYRSWNHAVLYHTNSLTELRRSFAEGQP